MVPLSSTDPYGKDVPLKISREGGDKYRYEFSPRHTGKYLVHVDVENTALPGSPFVYFVQPSSGVIVTDVTEEGEVGEEMYFIGMGIFYLVIATPKHSGLTFSNSPKKYSYAQFLMQYFYIHSF